MANVHTRVQCTQSQNRATIVGEQLKIFDPPPAFAAASITPGRATLASPTDLQAIRGQLVAQKDSIVGSTFSFAKVLILCVCQEREAQGGSGNESRPGTRVVVRFRSGVTSRSWLPVWPWGSTRRWPFAVVRHLSIMAERIVPDHGSEQSDLPVHPPLHEVGRS